MEGLFWLLLPVAAYSGWYAATKHQKNLQQTSTQEKPCNSTGYSEGIETFISEQPDKAVEMVINKVEVNPETVEVHLALGNLYRRTGEVDRAIRLHQNLSEKLSLRPLQREQVLYELGLDYLSSGLLDRAEQIFKDLLSTKSFATSSAKALVELYQQEKEWLQAIEYLKKFEALSGKSKRPVISQYYCELAQKEVMENNVGEARKLLGMALQTDKNCVRANFMLAELFYGEEEYTQALKYYLATAKQDSAFLPEVVEPVVNCLLAINQKQSLSNNIPGLLEQYLETGDEVVMGSTSNNGLDHGKKAIKFIEQKLDKNPSIKLLNQYLYLTLDNQNSMTDRQLLTKVKNTLMALSQKEAGYRCQQCGFSSHNLHWQCPSCHTWSSIKPI